MQKFVRDRFLLRLFLVKTFDEICDTRRKLARLALKRIERDKEKMIPKLSKLEAIKKVFVVCVVCVCVCARYLARAMYSVSSSFVCGVLS